MFLCSTCLIWGGQARIPASTGPWTHDQQARRGGPPAVGGHPVHSRLPCGGPGGQDGGTGSGQLQSGPLNPSCLRNPRVPVEYIFLFGRNEQLNEKLIKFIGKREDMFVSLVLWHRQSLPNTQFLIVPLGTAGSCGSQGSP